jgi:hypothetical protein
MGRRHMEYGGEPPQGGVGRPVGPVDPESATIAPSFVWVTARWVLKAVPDVWIGWRRFARVVGPWILVLNMWRHLIRRQVLLLDWWGVMDTCHPVCQHVATWSGVGPIGPTWCLVHISLIRALCMRMIYSFQSSRRARLNGVDQFGIWGCLDDVISMPLIYLLSIASFHVHFDMSCNKR